MLVPLINRPSEKRATTLCDIAPPRGSGPDCANAGARRVPRGLPLHEAALCPRRCAVSQAFRREAPRCAGRSALRRRWMLGGWMLPRTPHSARDPQHPAWLERCARPRRDDRGAPGVESLQVIGMAGGSVLRPPRGFVAPDRSMILVTQSSLEHHHHGRGFA